MPRLPPSLFRYAKRQSPHISTLLPACRSIESARNELRWIKDYLNETSPRKNRRRLAELCRQRGRGVPLQYILGSQPFGSLDIKCRPGVLIPRPETEAYTCYLIDLIKSGALLGSRKDMEKNGLNLIDFCTGTGCIPLLLFSSLQKLVNKLTIYGVDISPQAIQLARDNIAHNIELRNLQKPTDVSNLTITKADVFSDEDIQLFKTRRWDVLVSNPPYISQDVWNNGRGQLGYSVRKYEPPLALIPEAHLPCPPWCSPEDVFYARLLDVAEILSPGAILLEIGDEAQAHRVLQLYFQHKIAATSKVELWRDYPDIEARENETTHVEIATERNPRESILVKGTGLMRSVFITNAGETQHSFRFTHKTSR